MVESSPTIRDPKTPGRSSTEGVHERAKTMAVIGHDGLGLCGAGVVLAACWRSTWRTWGSAAATAAGSSRRWRSRSTAVPLGAGQLVDRLMATQRVLALIYALGTGLLVVLASGWVDSAGGLFAVFLVYWAVTAPAYSLCQLAGDAQPRRSGPGVRLGAALGDGGLDGRRLGRLAGDGRVGLDPGRPGGLRGALGRRGVLRGRLALLPDAAPHAAAGRRPARRGGLGRAASSWSGSPDVARRPGHVVRRLPDPAPGLPGHPRLSRGDRACPAPGSPRR